MEVTGRASPRLPESTAATARVHVCYDMDATLVLLQRHQSGIHVVT